MSKSNEILEHILDMLNYNISKFEIV